MSVRRNRMNDLLHQEQLQQDRGYDPLSSQKLLHWWCQSAPSLNAFDTEWTFAPSLEFLTLHSNHVVNLTVLILRKKISTMNWHNFKAKLVLPVWAARWKLDLCPHGLLQSVQNCKNQVEVQIFSTVVHTEEISATSNKSKKKPTPKLFFFSE